MLIPDSNKLAALDNHQRAQLVNSLLGFKPALLPGISDAQGRANLTLMTSVVHLGASPPLKGVFFRPHSVPRHSLENILATGSFTLNLITGSIFQQAHQTSARYSPELSEFATTGLEEVYSALPTWPKAR